MILLKHLLAIILGHILAKENDNLNLIFWILKNILSSLIKPDLQSIKFTYLTYKYWEATIDPFDVDNLTT